MTKAAQDQKCKVKTAHFTEMLPEVSIHLRNPKSIRFKGPKIGYHMKDDVMYFHQAPRKSARY